MRDASDMELVREYARQNSEAAFAELVQRHLGLVYSAALRHAGAAAQAEEITQAVFIILARKAGCLRPHVVLAAWLYETTRWTALGYLRAERRRQFREQEAYMQSIFQESTTDPAWSQMAPLLDAAMMRLGGKEREAIVLRFFKGKTLREAAAGLDISEAAAQKRVNRALEKLHRYFSQRGISSTTAIIAGELSANSVHAAPAALAQVVTVAAIAKGAVASASALTLIKGTLKIMAWTKVKTAIIASACVLLAAGTTTVVTEKFLVRMNSVLTQHLEDGSTLVLDGVSFGHTHKFGPGRSRGKSWTWPGHDELVLEFRLENNNGDNPLVKHPIFRQHRLLLRGAEGIEYVEEFEPEFSGFKKDAGGYYGYMATSIFPRDSKWLWLRLEQRDDSEHYDVWRPIAEFKFPNPASSANQIWTAAPAPVTNTAAGMDFVLGQITVKVVPSYTNDIWNHVVTVPTEVWDNGTLLTNWGRAFTSWSDASGNSMSVLQNHRSLDPRYVWKLDMDFEPVSDLSPESIATIPVPKLSQPVVTNVMGVPVTVSWDGTLLEATMPANKSNLALKFVGVADEEGNAGRNGSGGGGLHHFRMSYFMFKKGDQWTMGAGVNPATVTFAVVPNIHTTFYAQPELIPGK